MANLKLLTPEHTNVSSGSGAYKITFEASELIQDYDLSLTSSTFKVVNAETAIYLEREDPGSNVYSLFIYYNENRSINFTSINYVWSLNVQFLNETKQLNGAFTQSGNPNAPYIKNIRVYDPNGELLERDAFNRWIIPNSYPANTEFIISYDKLYPGHDTLWVSNVNVTNVIKQNFVDNVYPFTPNSSKLIITNAISDGTVEVQIEFDDTAYYAISATTYVLFTRGGIELPLIIIDQKEFNNADYSSGQLSTGIEFKNINKNQINISSSVSWLSAYIQETGAFYSLKINLFENTGEQRTGVITVFGTNSDGLYVSEQINITLSAKELPYIGDAQETIVLWEDFVMPVIRYDYKGNLNPNTSSLTLFNYFNNRGEDNVDNILFLINGETPIDLFDLRLIPGSKNVKLNAKQTYTPNFSETEQIINITVYMDLSDGTNLESAIALIIEASPENIYRPIWKDTYFECTRKYFRLRNFYTNEIIYNGIIYNEYTNQVKVNDILKSFININKNPFTNVATLNNQLISVLIETSSTEDFAYYEEEKIYHLYWDYSFDYNATEQIMGDYTTGYFGMHAGIDIEANFANPIEYYDSRQYIFINDPQGYRYYNQTSSQVLGDNDVILAQIPKNYFRGDILTFTIKPGNNSFIAYHIDHAIGEDEDHDYAWHCGYLKCTNADYAVYYKNSYGIWCWMLFEGKQMESHKITQKKYLTGDGNFNSYNINNAVYNTNVEEFYNLTSVYLTDEQSNKLKELYTSPLIYVHDLNKDVVYNCMLDTTNYDIKTFRNQGRKFFTHTIKLKKSLNKNILV